MGRPKKKKKAKHYTYRVSYDVTACAEGTVYITVDSDEVKNPDRPPEDEFRTLIEQNCEGQQQVCTDNNYGGVSYHEVDTDSITPDYEDSNAEWNYYPTDITIKDWEHVTDRFERRYNAEPFVTRMEVYHPLNHKLDDSECYTFEVGKYKVRVWAEPNQHTRTEIEGAGLNASVMNNIIDSIADGDFKYPGFQGDHIDKDKIRRLYNGIL